MPKRIEWSKDRPQRPDHDPMLSDLRSLLTSDKRSHFAKANSSGPAPGTLKNIESGKTKRPQGVTIQMAYQMLGYKIVAVKQ